MGFALWLVSYLVLFSLAYRAWHAERLRARYFQRRHAELLRYCDTLEELWQHARDDA